MRTPSGIHAVKGFMSWECFVEAFQKYRLEQFENDLFLHFRRASKGSITAGNTHPFPLSAALEELRKTEFRTDYVLMHNGTLLVTPVTPELSDTAELSRRLGEGCFQQKIPECLALLKSFIGTSRIAVMTPDQVHLAGEWHTRDQVLFSNLRWDLKDLGCLGKMTSGDSGILHEFTWDDCPCQIMEPKEPKKTRSGNPWIWKTGKITSSDFEKEMLDRGYYLASMQTPNECGASESLKLWDSFFTELLKYRFCGYPVLYSTGPDGLMVYHWGGANPRKIGCIYSEDPVCEFPGSSGGKGNVPRTNESGNEAESLNCFCNPADHLAPLVQAGVPMIYNMADDNPQFPADEYTRSLVKNYLAACKVQVFRQGGKFNLQSVCDAVEDAVRPKL